MKKLIILLSVTFFLAGCVDTTGLSSLTSKTPRGDPNANVVVTEFSDFECPACRTTHVITTQPLLEKYGTKIRFDFKQFPLLTIHELALPLAEASECAADQGKFWEFVDMVYEQQLAMDKEQKKVASSDIATWAQSLGLNMEVFGRCTASHIKKAAVLAEFEEGRKLNVGGTPTFFVNGKQLEQNDLASVSAAINAALAVDGTRKL
ncbi:MAG: thioredoxin domain-containing protein [Candidatus Peribacteraceae bacterium]|jgi:protein-disulfide isomerase